MKFLHLSLVLTVLASIARSAPVPWDPISPAELAAPAVSTLDPEAPAEALFRRIDVDDSLYPYSRTTTTYVRYRIFNPEKATNLTRIAEQSISVGGEELRGASTMRARLTLPDGTVHEFGNESIRERNVVQGGANVSFVQRIFGGQPDLQISERFLAVAGVVPGAILEIQTSHLESNLANIIGPRFFTANLQQMGTPARLMSFSYHSTQDNAWIGRPFTMNAEPNHAEISIDRRHRILHIEAHGLPALYREPFSIAAANYALTFVIAYQPTHSYVRSHHGVGRTDYTINTKTDPWGNYATITYMMEEDRTGETGSFRRLASSITAAAPDERTKAQLIHQYVHALYNRFRAAPHPRMFEITDYNDVLSEMQLTEFEKHAEVYFQPVDFTFLEVALAQGAGLQAETVMLPNLTVARFDERMVADQFLPVYAARIRWDNDWHYCLPTGGSWLAFDELPWQNEGEEALVAKPVKQEFVPVPAPAASQSKITTTGTFTLSPEGVLIGTGTRSFTGHHAAARRQAIRNMTAERAKRFFERNMQADLKGAAVRVTEIKAAHDPEVPLEIAFKLTWPDFAVATKSRLIFHPSIFHFNQRQPFTAAERRYPFQFPYRWSETEHVDIAMPPEFTMESKNAPSNIPGDSVSYRCSISLSPVSKQIHYSRDFSTAVLVLSAEANKPLMNWYQSVADRDNFELVLHRTEAKPEAADTGAP